MRFEQNFSLKEYNTFSVEAKAKRFLVLHSIEDAEKFFAKYTISEPIFFLGGGSNILFISDFDGLVIYPNLRGIKIFKNTNDSVILEVFAGESWHHFVEICVKNHFFGLENLALIPGKISGAIVQNIGAYGEEVRNFVVEVSGFDLNSRQFITLNNEECQYSYRNSIFKNQLKGQFLILSAKFNLFKKPNLNLSYSDLQTELKKFPTLQPDPKWLFDTVCRIRSSKLPDIKKYPNAGSFFKNPIVDDKIIQTIKQKFPDLKTYTAGDGKSKIPAGWLIEKAGWKGKRVGMVGTYKHHALVIINYGVKNGKEIYDFATLLREEIDEKFGIKLEFEVEIVGNPQ